MHMNLSLLYWALSIPVTSIFLKQKKCNRGLLLSITPTYSWKKLVILRWHQNWESGTKLFSCICSRISDKGCLLDTRNVSNIQTYEMRIQVLEEINRDLSRKLQGELKLTVYFVDVKNFLKVWYFQNWKKSYCSDSQYKQMTMNTFSWFFALTCLQNCPLRTHHHQVQEQRLRMTWR